jgi:chemotaxis protein CheY-P-specific phosphatase CheC
MTDLEKITDILTEFINIGTGKAANALNLLFGSHTSIIIPSITVFRQHEKLIGNRLPKKNDEFFVTMNFHGAVNGSAALLFSSESIAAIANLIGAGPEPDKSTLFHKSVLLETANIVINAIIGSICNMVKSEVEYSVPVTSDSLDFVSDFSHQDYFTIEAQTTLTLKDHNISTIVQLNLENIVFVEQYLKEIKQN